MTSLHSAIDSGKENVVRVIAEFVNNNVELKITLLLAKNNDGLTPPDLAKQGGKKNIIDMVKLLENTNDNSAACRIC